MLMTSIAKPFDAAHAGGDANAISAEGLDAHWMAYSGNRQFKKDPRILVGADGIYYIDTAAGASWTACPACGPAVSGTTGRRSPTP
jgi:hypothetical protein